MNKIIVLLITLLSANLTSKAQHWSELGTGSGALHPNAYINTICLDRVGNVYAAGVFWDMADTTNYIAKWDGTMWGKIYTGFNTNNIVVLITDTSGNLFAAGEFTNSSGNYYVAKWDGVSWTEVGAGSGPLNANRDIESLIFDKHGNLYAAGAFTNSAGFAYVAKWDGVSWTEVGAGGSPLNANDGIASIFIDTADNIYAGGGFTDSASHIGGNLYVAKWNGTTWTEVGAGVSPSLHGALAIWSVLADLNGNVYAAGHFYNSSGKFYVAKWDGSTWNELGVGINSLSANDYISSMCFDTCGNLYAAGAFTDTVLPYYGHQYVAKWDGLTWSEVGIGVNKLNANDVISSICSDITGNLYAAGLFTNTAGYEYVAKYNVPPITAVTNLHTQERVLIYPNPVHDDINIQLNSTNSELIGTEYSLYDYAGKCYIKSRFEESNTVIDINRLSSGMYVLKIGAAAYKIIKD